MAWRVLARACSRETLPSATPRIDSSMLALMKGLARPRSRLSQALTRFSPSSVGTNLPLFFAANSLFWMVSRCSVMVASVPMPCLSISPSSSASLRCSGAVVVPRSSRRQVGANRSPSLTCGSTVSNHFSQGQTYRQLSYRTRTPLLQNSSWPTSASIVRSSPTASLLQQATKCLTTSSQTFHSLGVQSASCSGSTGWIGGWALSSLSPPRGRSNPPASSCSTQRPQGPSFCFQSRASKSMEGANLLVQVRGQLMKPFWYSFYAMSMIWLAGIFSFWDPIFCRSRVAMGLGLNLRMVLLLDLLMWAVVPESLSQQLRQMTSAQNQSYILPRLFFSSIFSPLSFWQPARISKKGSGLNFLISKSLNTTKPRVGIWHGPQLTNLPFPAISPFCWSATVWNTVKADPMRQSIYCLKLTLSLSSRLGSTRVRRAVVTSWKVTAENLARRIRSRGLAAVQILMTQKAMASPSRSQSSHRLSWTAFLAKAVRLETMSLFRSPTYYLMLALTRRSTGLKALQQVLYFQFQNLCSKTWPLTEVKQWVLPSQSNWQQGLQRDRLWALLQSRVNSLVAPEATLGFSATFKTLIQMALSLTLRLKILSSESHWPSLLRGSTIVQYFDGYPQHYNLTILFIKPFAHFWARTKKLFCSVCAGTTLLAYYDCCGPYSSLKKDEASPQVPSNRARLCFFIAAKPGPAAFTRPSSSVAKSCVHRPRWGIFCCLCCCPENY